MKQYEYRCVSSGDPVVAGVAQLNKLGAEGFRVVQQNLGKSGGMYWLLEREIPQTSPYRECSSPPRAEGG